MIRYGTKEEVEAYFEDGSANQSYLKQLVKGVDYLEEKEEVLYYKEKGHFLIGSGVDIWITQGKRAFDDQHYVFGAGKPSDTIMSIVKKIFDQNITEHGAPSTLLEDLSTQIIDSCNYHAYQMRWKDETRINKIIAEGTNYFESLKDAYGKTILSKEEGDLIYAVVSSLESNNLTESYFKDTKDVDLFFQVPIYFIFEGVQCKALIDVLRVDRKHKTVEALDIKTTGGFVIDFPWAIKSRGYDFQGSFYTQALLNFKNGFGSTPVQEIGDISDYNILTFKFIVETTKTKDVLDAVEYYTGKPLLFNLSNERLMIGKYGRPALVQHVAVDGEPGLTEVVRHKEILGFKQAIDLHKYYEINGFQYDKSVLESNGVILIK